MWLARFASLLSTFTLYTLIVAFTLYTFTLYTIADTLILLTFSTFILINKSYDNRYVH